MKNTKKKGKGRKAARIILIILIILLAAGFLIGRNLKLSDGSGSSSGSGISSSSRQNALLAEQLDTEEVTRGSISVVTEGDGVIEAADENVYTAEYPLTVDEVKVENGDVVGNGDEIATLDRDSIEDELDVISQQLAEADSAIASASDDGSDVLTAPVSGRVKRIYAHPGDLLSEVSDEYGGVVEISADGQLKVEFESSREIEIGEDVTVSFLSYDVDGYIVSGTDGTYTAVIDDAYEYPVDQKAQVKDEHGNKLGEGELKSDRPYLVTASYGRVNEISVELNASVSAGDTLLTRTEHAYNADYRDLLEQRQDLIEDQKKLNALKKDPVILAEADGIVTDLSISDSTPMTQNQAMYSLISTDEFYLKAEIDELDIAGVEVGQKASVVFDALEDQTYEGTVRKISAIGNNINGVTTYTVTISLTGTEDMKTNMSATASIVTDSRDDVLLVPVDAVQTSGSQRYVTVLSDDGTTQNVNVETGLVNNSMAEITGGDLAEGDTVVVYSSSTEEEITKLLNSQSGSSGSSTGTSQDNSSGTAGSTSGSSGSSSGTGPSA